MKKFTAKEYIDKYENNDIHHWDDVTEVTVKDIGCSRCKVTTYTGEKSKIKLSTFTIKQYKGKYVLHGLYTTKYDDKSIKFKGYFRYGNLHRDGDKPAVRRWHKNGTRRAIMYFKENEVYRDAGIAFQEWYPNGKLRWEFHQLNGEFHRVGDAAIRLWNEAGLLIVEEWAIKGTCHRRNAAAFRLWNDNGVLIKEKWAINDKLHREGDAAIRQWNDEGKLINEEWWEYGKKHKNVLTKVAKIEA